MFRDDRDLDDVLLDEILDGLEDDDDDFFRLLDELVNDEGGF
jgi:hypothetical protein